MIFRSFRSFRSQEVKDETVFGEFLPTVNYGIWFHLSTEYWHMGISFR